MRTVGPGEEEAQPPSRAWLLGRRHGRERGRPPRCDGRRVQGERVSRDGVLRRPRPTPAPEARSDTRCPAGSGHRGQWESVRTNQTAEEGSCPEQLRSRGGLRDVGFVPGGKRGCGFQTSVCYKTQLLINIQFNFKLTVEKELNESFKFTSK